MDDFAKWVQTYQAIIAVVLGVIGWVANHQLTLRAQRKSFLNQLYNTARLEITSQLKCQEEYLKELSSFCLFPILKDNTNNQQDFGLKAIESMMKRRNHKWLYVLEEYQTLFPELQIAINILKADDIRIGNCIMIAMWRIMENKSGNKLPKTDETTPAEDSDYVLRTIGLFQDLIVYIQVKSFSIIANNPMPEKLTGVIDRPRFGLKDGKLVYIEDIS